MQAEHSTSIATALLTDEELRDIRPEDISYERAIDKINHPEGERLMLESEKSGYSQYKPMNKFFEAQILGSFCGIASCSVVLNALHHATNEMIAAKRKRSDNDDAETQNGLDQSEQYRLTQHIVYETVLLYILGSQPKQMNRGLALGQMKQLFELCGARVEIRSSKYPHEIRRMLKSDCLRIFAQSPMQQCIVCNFWRNYQQHAGGHISPLAAYHPQTERVLILEVAQHRAPPHWLGIADLAVLMCRVDKASDLPRGYLIVSLPSVL